jgi:hypothetical protein
MNAAGQPPHAQRPEGTGAPQPAEDRTIEDPVESLLAAVRERYRSPDDWIDELEPPC